MAWGAQVRQGGNKGAAGHTGGMGGAGETRGDKGDGRGEGREGLCLVLVAQSLLPASTFG